jgi:hypothetical protein
MNTSWRLWGFLAACSVFSACESDSINYRPSPQLLPQHIHKIAVRPVTNKTQQFGLEDKLTLAIIDEFLRNGEYSIVPEAQADGIVVTTITRYILTPIQYNAVLTPVTYKLQILLDVQFVDKKSNTILWDEPNIDGILTYTNETLKGGITEEQAREQIWNQLAVDVVRRVVQGFGSVTGTSQRAISGQPPPTEGKPVLPPKPVNPNPY